MSQQAAGAGRFRGGIHIDVDPTLLGATDIVPIPVPKQLLLPLAQHAGRPSLPLVRPGDRVLRGQQIAKPDGLVSAALHASSSGTVAAVEPRPIPHPSGLTDTCIVIDTDGADQALPRTPIETDYHHVDPMVLRVRIGEAGIVGLGGAAFPTSVKLTAEAEFGLHTLILNGAECDPYINCDDTLMQHRADAIVAGARVLLHVLQINKCIVAIEADKPQAEAALKAAVEAADEDRFEVRSVPALYPEGSERQLIQVLSGREVPHDGLPLDVGFVCINVATAAAVDDAINDGRPLISRLVSVCGSGIGKPAVVEARLGTPIAALVAACGGYRDGVDRVVVGGAMMGFSLRDDSAPVVKGVNSVMPMIAREARQLDTVMPCIRCGECARVCPAALQPQSLFWHAQADQFERCRDLSLIDCIECGCCDYVCPSHIPLAAYFRYAKAEIRVRDLQQRQANTARDRFKAHEARVAAQKAEKAQRPTRRKQALAGDARKETDDKQVVAAALARARAKRATKTEGADPADD